jgi:Ca2+-binding EF-hand superfamily protein
MPRPKKVIVKRTPQEIRAEVRSYIKNERDTVLKKWMALEETIHSEDTRKEQFIERQLKLETHSIPLNIKKFIGTLKKAVRKTMRDKGGTPFSIIRQMFLYWDADKSGEISESELKLCMDAMGVKMTRDQRVEVVTYYDSGKGTEEMNYTELLKDILLGEPSIIHYAEGQVKDKDVGVRYEEIADIQVAMPFVVKQFIDASREYIAVKMRNEGGTPFEHIRSVFIQNDFTYSNALDAHSLLHAARKTMKLKMEPEEAQIILGYYDRKKTGRMNYKEFLLDVCVGVKSILTFTDLSPRGIEKHKQEMSKNQFIPKPFKALPTKVLEKFKREMKAILLVKISAVGGTMRSWLKEAFTNWDNKGMGKISDPEGLRIICKHLNCNISYEDAVSLINTYDRDHDGAMAYWELIKDLAEEDPHFMEDSQPLLNDIAQPASARTPANVMYTIRKFRTALEAYARKSKGEVKPRDILHGTFLRFDRSAGGRVIAEEIQMVAKELGVPLKDNEVSDLLLWFDTNASGLLDYNEFTRQLFGDDIQTRTLTLPKLSKKANAILLSKGLLNPTVMQHTRPLSSPLKQSLSNNNLVTNNEFSTQRPNSTTDIKMNSSNDSSSTYSLSNNTFGTSAAAELSAVYWKSHNRETMKDGLIGKDKIMQLAESRAVKEARRLAKRDLILEERSKVQKKLESVEAQRRALIEDYKARKSVKIITKF